MQSNRRIRTIFHIDLDAFFVSVEQALNPELKGKVVIVGGRPDRRGVVASASYEARKRGVHAAMPLSTARRLCPQAVFLTGNYNRYREYSEKFMQILGDYSPCLEPGGLDEAYLDVTGCENFGSWRSLAVRIKARVRDELDIIASTGIATCKVVAKVASDYGKPDGLVEVLPGGEKEFLAPLKVDKLPGVGKKTAGTLKLLGIETIGDLARMQADKFVRHFGTGMLWLHEHASGIDNDPVQVHDEVKSISRETTFDTDTLDDNFLKATLRYFSEKLGTELRQNGKCARTVTLKLRYASFETIHRSKTCSIATSNDEDIFQVAVRILNNATASGKSPVRLIGLEVSNLTEGEKQLNLFEAEQSRKDKLDKAIDQLRDKYGFDAIVTGTTLEFKQKYSRPDKLK